MKKGSLEPRNSARWQLCDLATGWTRETLSLTSYQSLQAVLTKHVETLEQLWLFVGLQTYPACDLFLDLLESFLGSIGVFGSHGSVSSAAGEKVQSILRQAGEKVQSIPRQAREKVQSILRQAGEKVQSILWQAREKVQSSKHFEHILVVCHSHNTIVKMLIFRCNNNPPQKLCLLCVSIALFTWTFVNHFGMYIGVNFLNWISIWLVSKPAHEMGLMFLGKVNLHCCHT